MHHGMYHQYIGGYEYRAERCGRPLLEIIRSHRARRAIDLAAGAGHELRYLATEQMGLVLSGNELDSKAVRWLQAVPEIAHVPIFSADWRRLPEEIPFRYDFAFCIGNSITYLPDRQSIGSALKGMAALLMPGGHLLVDSRNHDAWLARPDEAKSSILGENIMYASTDIGTRVVHLSSERAILESFMLNNPGECVQFSFYPLTACGLRSLSSTAGLTLEQTRVDWEPVLSDSEIAARPLDSFVQYVLRKT